MEFDFTTVEAVIFNLDGTLYDDSDFWTQLCLSDLFHIRQIKCDIETRKQLRNIDFGNEENFYSAYFEEAAKRCHMKKENYRLWYFTKYLPRMCRIIKDYCQKRDGIEELFEQLERTETPFMIFSDYAFAKERAQAMGLRKIENIQFFSAEKMGCLKPMPRAFKEIEESIIFRNYPSENILVVSTDEENDGIGAKNAGFSFLKITTTLTDNQESSENAKDKFPVMTWEAFSTRFNSYLRQKAVKNVL